MDILRPVWAEIDLDAIAHNIREIRRITASKAVVMGIVKANGYGHGAVEVARTILANGAERLGVAVLEEGRQLREAGISVPILVLGAALPETALAMLHYDLTPTVCTYDGAKALSAAAKALGKEVKVHIKVDTGMGRIGVFPDEKGAQLIKEIAELPNLQIEGIFTHFAAADEKNKEYTLSQFDKFLGFTSKLEEMGIEIPIRHVANSAALLDLPQTHLDMVRPGIILYGLYPSQEVERKIQLRPAMALKAKVVYVKEVPEGAAISYGRTFVAQEKCKILSLPMGYADGFSRLLSNKGEVLVKGRRVRIVGRVCMDQCLALYEGDENAEIGEEVVIMGQQGEEEISAEEIADHLGTINYEVVCMVGGRVPRKYKENGNLSHSRYLRW